MNVISILIFSFTYIVSEEMPPRMDFRLSHTGDLTSADQPQHLSAPATADPSAHQASTKMERNFPERTLKKCQSSSLDDPKEDAKGSKLKPVGKVKSNVQQVFRGFISSRYLDNKRSCFRFLKQLWETKSG